MSEQKLKRLEIIKRDNEYKITKYIKTLELVEIEEPELPKLTRWQKLRRVNIKKQVYNLNPIYNQLTIRQKQLLHTIAPLWANIIEHGMEGNMIITDDMGKRYDLTSMNSRHCLVGEAYGFGFTSCSTCAKFNYDFAGMNDARWRNAYYMPFIRRLPEFLNHYDDFHWRK